MFLLFSRELVSAFSLQLALNESLLCILDKIVYSLRVTLAFIVYSGRDRPSEFGQFQVLPEAVLNCLTSCLKSFPAGWKVSIRKAIVTRHSPNGLEIATFPLLPHVSSAITRMSYHTCMCFVTGSPCGPVWP